MARHLLPCDQLLDTRYGGFEPTETRRTGVIGRIVHDRLTDSISHNGQVNGRAIGGLTAVKVLHVKEPNIDCEFCDILNRPWIDFAPTRADEFGVPSAYVYGRAI
jgi:hypothetical protein